MNQIQNKPEEGMPLVSWRPRGTREFPGWTMGKIVTDIGDVSVGDILLSDSGQFNSMNLCRVTEFPEFPPESRGTRFYAVFVDPRYPDHKWPGRKREVDFCVWDFQIQKDCQNHFYRVHRTAQSIALSMENEMKNQATMIIEAAPETAEFRNVIPERINLEKARLIKTAVLRPEIGEIFPSYKDLSGKCVRVSAEKIQYNPKFKEFEVLFRVYRDMSDESFLSHFSPRALSQFCL